MDEALPVEEVEQPTEAMEVEEPEATIPHVLLPPVFNPSTDHATIVRIVSEAIRKKRRGIDRKNYHEYINAVHAEGQMGKVELIDMKLNNWWVLFGFVQSLMKTEARFALLLLTKHTPPS